MTINIMEFDYLRDRIKRLEEQVAENTVAILSMPGKQAQQQLANAERTIAVNNKMGELEGAIDNIGFIFDELATLIDKERKYESE